MPREKGMHNKKKKKSFQKKKRKTGLGGKKAKFYIFFRGSRRGVRKNFPKFMEKGAWGQPNQGGMTKVHSKSLQRKRDTCRWVQ